MEASMKRYTALYWLREEERNERWVRTETYALEKKDQNRVKRQGERERLYPSVSGQLPSAQISLMGTQSVHLFKPAGHHYLSQWQLHPQTHPHTHQGGGWSWVEELAVEGVQARIWILYMGTSVSVWEESNEWWCTRPERSWATNHSFPSPTVKQEIN